MDKIVLDDLSPEDRERLDRLQKELEGQNLISLLKRLMEKFELSANQVAVSAGMDESAFSKILKGEHRQFKAEHVDLLLEDLYTLGIMPDPIEQAAWRRALRVASCLHLTFNKAVETRFHELHDDNAREEPLQSYARKQFLALGKVCESAEKAFPKYGPFNVEGLPRESFEPELVKIPAGNFWMGGGISDPDAGDDEKPLHKIYLPEFWIGRYSITNEEYRHFLRANPTRKAPVMWIGDMFPAGKARHPVVNVTWYEAIAYCDWLSKVTGKNYNLPSEAEWEKAARGSDPRIYPWGKFFDRTRLNSRAGGEAHTTPVGKYSPGGDSPYGCADMAGNVSEWARSLWGKDWSNPDFKYPYDPADGREDLEAPYDLWRVLRGGSWFSNLNDARCSARYMDLPCFRYYHVGFRVVCSPGAL